MDGVLVDGEPLHFRAVNQLLAEEGLSISLEAYKPYMGTKAGWSDMIRDMGLSKPEEYYVPRYHEIILEQYRTRSTPLPGAVELVNALRDAGMPLALASSSRASWVDACLKAIGLDEAFPVRITGSDIEHGKPAPDIYLRAAERLDTDPRQCLAIEDAPAGILSAKAAGMTVWAVRTEYTRDLDLPGPHREFAELRDISVDDIMGVAV